MTDYVWGGDSNPEVHNAISRWVSSHSFGTPDNTWDGSTSYGVIKNGVPVGGMVFHDYKPQSGTIQYSGAAIDRTWLMGPSLHNAFSYMFDDLGCQMVLTGNSSENTGLHSLLKRTDHKLHVIERGWGPDTDLYLWTLTREQWLANPIMKHSRKKAEESQNV